MSIASKLTNYESTTSLGSWFRKRRSHHLYSLLRNLHSSFGCVNIIDIGGRPSYWNIFPATLFEEMNISVLLVNYDDEIPPDQVDHRFTQLQADACDLSMFDDDTFHLAHSNSVVEHVGNWERMQKFAYETNRVASAYYMQTMQTPNFSFPIEPHYMMPFVHWLPEQTRAAILQKARVGYLEKGPNVVNAMDVVQSIQLLSRPMVEDLFPSARIEKEYVGGLCKSLIAINDLESTEFCEATRKAA